jgi:hypothetical protein
MLPPIKAECIRVLKTNNWLWMAACDDWNTSTLERLTLVLAPRDVFLFTIPHPITATAVPRLAFFATPNIRTITWKFVKPAPWQTYTKDTFLRFLSETLGFGFKGFKLIFRGYVRLRVGCGHFFIDRVIVQFDDPEQQRPRQLPTLQWDYAIAGSDGRRFITAGEHGTPPMSEGCQKGTWLAHHK